MKESNDMEQRDEKVKRSISVIVLSVIAILSGNIAQADFVHICATTTGFLDLTLTQLPVPEPTSMGLLGIDALSLSSINRA